jgi:uncharacterized cupin superfamily protein
VSEARLRKTEHGLVPEGDGWFVLNAREAVWHDDHEFGVYTPFSGEERFPQVGVNLAVLGPGQPACMYHGEDEQEDFLLLAGECLLIVEGEERTLQAWDFVHCPPWTEHVFVGAGDGPCVLLLIGSRTGDGVVYPRNEAALRRRAGVEQETRSPQEAYASHEPSQPISYGGWLPDF